MKQRLGSIFNAGQKNEYEGGIPNEDMLNWIKALRQGGFSEEETDEMMVYLNREYAKVKGNEIASRKMRELVEQIKQGYGHTSSVAEKQEIKKRIISGFKK